MAELVDATDSKSVVRKDVGVRFPPGAPIVQSAINYRQSISAVNYRRLIIGSLIVRLLDIFYSSFLSFFSLIFQLCCFLKLKNIL